MNTTINLDSGIPDALKKLPTYREWTPPDPAYFSWAIAGKNGSGKTTLLCSWPEALLVDCQPVPGAVLVPKKRAWCVWAPVLTEKEVTDTMKNPPKGKPVATSIESVFKTLTEMSKTKDAPVKSVIFDSVEDLQLMEMKRLEVLAGKSFAEIGQAGWRDANNGTAAYIRKAMNLGFGVGISIPLKDEFKDMKSSTGTITKIFLRPTITDGLVSVLRGVIDFTITVEPTKALTNGKTETRYDVKTELNTEKKGNFELKKRIALPAVINGIPRDDGMQEVFKAYHASVATINAQLTPSAA